MSTHTASIPLRWRLVNSVRKYSSSVSFLRSFPNHNGSAVSRLHTTVRNLSRFPWYSSSTPMCRNGGFRRLASQRSKYRRSMPRTALCQTHPPRHLPRRGALTGLPHRVLKPFAVGRLAGQLRHLLRLHSARRAIHPIQFHHHRGLILKARQIPDLSFIHLVHLVHPSSAARTGHAAIPPLAPDQQLELLVLFVDLLLIDPIARESQHLRPVVLHDQPSLVATLLPPHLAQTSHFCVVHPWPSGWRRPTSVPRSSAGEESCVKVAVSSDSRSEPEKQLRPERGEVGQVQELAEVKGVSGRPSHWRSLKVSPTDLDAQTSL